jgi:AAA domain
MRDNHFPVAHHKVPTLLIQGGAQYPGEDPSKSRELLVFETNLVRLQLDFENAMRRIAGSYATDAVINGGSGSGSGSSMCSSVDKGCVILCDRGACDIAAYMSSSLFEQVLHEIGYSHDTLLARYDIVCHLVTAADGHKSAGFYTLSNNEARSETAAQAIVLDKKSQACWDQHRARKIINNDDYNSFEEKLQAASDYIIRELDRMTSRLR